ncbi:MAG: hypothetical protein LBM98_01210, partial [Oscillospiraceae bacterium]|nr:hypothetical protein [Oscillospiraceae bacterium]
LETDTDYQKLVKYTRDFFRAFENHKTRDFKKPNSKYTTHLDRISFDYTELIARIKEESASDPLGFIELLSAELKPIVPYLPTKSIQELIDSGAINPVDYVDVTPKIKHIASSDVRFTYEYVENKDIAWDFFQPDLCIPLGGEAGKAALVKWQDRERLYDFEGAKSFPEVKEIGAHYQPHIVVIDCDTKEIRKLIQKILLDANLYYGCMLNKTKGTGQLFFQLDTSDVRRTLDVFNSKFTIGSLKFRHKAHIDILVFGKGYSRITESKELRLFATTKRGTLSGIS